MNGPVDDVKRLRFHISSLLMYALPRLLRFTNVDVSIASGILFFCRGANLTPICQRLLSFPVLDVSIAMEILRFTRVDVDIAKGMLMFIGGQTQHRYV